MLNCSDELKDALDAKDEVKDQSSLKIHKKSKEPSEVSSNRKYIL